MAYVMAVAALLFLTAIQAHASQYSCIDTGNGGEVVVEASSITEAEYKAKRERKPSAGFYKCGTRKSVGNEDSMKADYKAAIQRCNRLKQGHGSSGEACRSEAKMKYRQ